MATRPQTIADLTDAMGSPPGLSARRMFGEYALYLGPKVVAFVCDYILFVKPTPGALALVNDPVMAQAYPGSRLYIRLEGALDDPERALAALRAVAQDMPEPQTKPRKPKAPKAKDGLDHNA